MDTNAPLDLPAVFEQLVRHFGPQHWWPADTPWEIMVGAVLTQATQWKNVELAIKQLRARSWLDVTILANVPCDELADAIRPAGYYRVKAARLQALAQFVQHQYAGQLERMWQVDFITLRRQLLSIRGIGPETADAILLYAGKFPTFVIDAYTLRMAQRHGWLAWNVGYAEAQAVFAENLHCSAELYNEFHALIVQLGKTYCRTVPRCQECPLYERLPFDARGARGPQCPPISASAKPGRGAKKTQQPTSRGDG